MRKQFSIFAICTLLACTDTSLNLKPQIGASGVKNPSPTTGSNIIASDPNLEKAVVLLGAEYYPSITKLIFRVNPPVRPRAVTLTLLHPESISPCCNSDYPASFYFNWGICYDPVIPSDWSNGERWQDWSGSYSPTIRYSPGRDPASGAYSAMTFNCDLVNNPAVSRIFEVGILRSSFVTTPGTFTLRVVAGTNVYENGSTQIDNSYYSNVPEIGVAPLPGYNYVLDFTNIAILPPTAPFTFTSNVQGMLSSYYSINGGSWVAFPHGASVLIDNPSTIRFKSTFSTDAGRQFSTSIVFDRILTGMHEVAASYTGTVGGDIFTPLHDLQHFYTNYPGNYPRTVQVTFNNTVTAPFTGNGDGPILNPRNPKK